MTVAALVLVSFSEFCTDIESFFRMGGCMLSVMFSFESSTEHLRQQESPIRLPILDVEQGEWVLSALSKAEGN